MAMSKTDFKNAFREVVSSEFAHIPTDENSIDFTFSERFNKRMEKLIRSQKKVYYNLINTVYKRVAIICVVLLTMLTATFSVKAIREPIINFVKQVYETYTHYSFDGDTTEIIEREYTVKVPEDFHQTNKIESDAMISTEYTNSSNDIIDFIQMTTKHSIGFFVDNEKGDIETKTINGIEVEYKKWYDTQIVIWVKDGYAFEINCYGNIEFETIENMIKSLSQQKARCANGNTVVKYTYDIWGKLENITGTLADTLGITNPLRYRGYYYDTETELYYLQSRYYSPDLMRFISQDDVKLSNAQGEPLGSNLYAYCLNNPVNYSDLYGTWVLSVGFEGQAAFVLGIYAGIAINIDGYWNVFITYTIGFAIITNAEAHIQAYVAYYLGKNKASQLRGWGVSIGASFSFGAHMSSGGAIDIGRNGNYAGTVNVGCGAGVSIAPIPYFQTRVGYTGVITSFNLLSVLRTWANNTKKSFNILSLCVEMRKYRNYITICVKSFKKTIYLYKNGNLKVR